MAYLLPQQALKAFLVAGHLVPRPTRCPAQGQGMPCGAFAALGTVIEPGDAVTIELLSTTSGVVVRKDCQLPASMATSLSRTSCCTPCVFSKEGSDPAMTSHVAHHVSAARMKMTLL